jgi:hypothetical protein
MFTHVMHNESNWCKNVILADADYVDRVAFDLIVNFERMLDRRIPQADMACWLECIALDGGLREGAHETQVILTHDHRREQMDNFKPGRYATELDGQAFRGRLGEFLISATTTEGLASKDDLMADQLELVAAQPDVERIMVVPSEQQYGRMVQALRQAEGQKHVTLFAMQPMPAGQPRDRQGNPVDCRQEILGYSLMAALGIRSSEISPE